MFQIVNSLSENEYDSGADRVDEEGFEKLKPKKRMQMPSRRSLKRTKRKMAPRATRLKVMRPASRAHRIRSPSMKTVDRTSGCYLPVSRSYPI